MLTIIRLNQFKKDIKKISKSGSKDMLKLDEKNKELIIVRSGSHSELF